MLRVTGDGLEDLPADIKCENERCRQIRFEEGLSVRLTANGLKMVLA
jgi:hypothetical protein